MSGTLTMFHVKHDREECRVNTAEYIDVMSRLVWACRPEYVDKMSADDQRKWLYSNVRQVLQDRRVPRET